MADPLFLGLISGTSADGIDAALVAFAGNPSATSKPRVVATATTPYAPALREGILALAHGGAAITLDELGRLDIEIGAAFAAAAQSLLAGAGIEPAAVRAIGSHGQTVRHRPDASPPFTLQLGDPATIAERTGIVTIADFRRADVAAGGEGAPLLPALHAAVLADPLGTRAVLNLGGIANLTILAPGRDVIGFDTGPANGLLDAWAARHLHRPFDAEGAWARSGRADVHLLARLLDEPYFTRPPPKSTGREVFNLDWLDARLPPGIAPADVQATLLILSARSIARALQRQAPDVQDVLACGGGVHNVTLMDTLRAELALAFAGRDPPALATTAGFGLDPDFVEAIGFAWLARSRLAGTPGNLPSVTGARGPRVLGAVHAAPPVGA